jgi:MFS family permease
VRELWVVFGAKLLTILAYQVMNLTLVLWLSSDLGFSDQSASSAVAVWSGLMTFFTILVGSLVDAIGLRKALLLGICICFFSRGMMTLAGPAWLVLGCGLLPLALGEALLTPVMVAAIRRYTTTAQRSIAFSIFYALMNAGFGIAAFIFDFLRKNLGEHGQFMLPVFGLHLTTYRTLFLVSFLLTLPNLALIYFALRDGVEATDEGVRISPSHPKHSGESMVRTVVLHFQDAMRDTIRIFAGLWRQPAFYKFLAFLGLVVAVRLIFYHMYYTYPKFGIRELGAGAPIGRLWAVNSIAILILAPLVGALTQRISAYKMVVIGSFISASSVFLMAMPPAWFQPLADGRLGCAIGHVWLGLNGAVHPYYVMIFVYVLFLSLGEALWSPRLYEYTAAIAPKGQEASYMSLSFLPYFIAKFFVGMSSGFLLARYCPETGPRDSQTLWLIIALTTMITPVGLLVFRRYIRVHEAGRPD